MIKIKSYPISKVLLTNKVLSVYITQFWNDVFSQIKGEAAAPHKHLWLMCKVHYSEIGLGYKTLGHLRKVNFDDKEFFIEYLTERLGLLNDSYTTLSISKITFSYIINNGLATKKYRRLLKDLTDKSLSTHRFNKKNLPISMNPSDYGIVLVSNRIGTITRYIVSSNIGIYQIDKSLDGITSNVTVLSATRLKWTDTKLNDGFKREIGKSTIYFMDGEKVLRKQQSSTKPFKIEGAFYI